MGYPIPMGEIIPLNFLEPIREYFARTSARICRIEIGLVLPFVLREFHSPLVVNPVVKLAMHKQKQEAKKYTCYFHVSLFHFTNQYIGQLTDIEV